MADSISATEYKPSIEAQPAIPAAVQEQRLSRLLTVYVITGLFFMLLPGTFLGVWNLVLISGRQAAGSVSPAWIQAHGHAQIFGWIGSFILGIGFYSIPKLLRIPGVRLPVGWLCWGMWTGGVLLRWVVDVYEWQWRVFLPASALLELLAYLFFFRSVSGHHSQRDAERKAESWMLLVIGATFALLLTLSLNLSETVILSLSGRGPAFPHVFDQRLLVLSTWGSLVPLVWGFNARWMPVFLGLKAPRSRLLLVSFGLNSLGVVTNLLGWLRPSIALLLVGAATAPFALRLFEPAPHPAKVRGMHSSFPIFVRFAYVWLIVAAMLGVWALELELPVGVWGSARHALTVGFIATMVFSVAQRVLPTFAGKPRLFSTKLMFLGLALLTAGCGLRVSSEILAYQNNVAWAWRWLPVSALIEMAAVSIFGVNMALTFGLRFPTTGPEPVPR